MKSNISSVNNSLLFNNSSSLPYEQRSTRINNVNNNVPTIHQFEYSDTKQSQSSTNEIIISDIKIKISDGI